MRDFNAYYFYKVKITTNQFETNCNGPYIVIHDSGLVGADDTVDAWKELQRMYKRKYKVKKSAIEFVEFRKV